MEIVDIELNKELTIQVIGKILKEDNDIPNSFEIDNIQILKGDSYELVLWCNSEGGKMLKHGIHYPTILENIEQLILTKLEDNL